MTRSTLLIAVALSSLLRVAAAEDTIAIDSPGLAPSHIRSDGLLQEDWGTLDVQLTGDGLAGGTATVSAIRLDDVIPAAQISSNHGPVRLIRTVYRAPIHPAGVDVLLLELVETANVARDVTVRLQPSVGMRQGERVARIGGRAALLLPQSIVDQAPLLDWGYCDEASSLPGWAKPQGPCDSAFRNIRAGMGGVPIAYRFSVTPRSELQVVLGLCESHWAEGGRRPLQCQVEGAKAVVVDPVVKWGQHQPGLLVFQAQDRNGDGQLDVTVRSARYASDRNPILNAIWIFEPNRMPDETDVLAGAGNDQALYYVDVGGEKDQSIYPPTQLQLPVHLEPGQHVTLEVLVACRGGAVPLPATSSWTARSLRRAAQDVWRDWNQP